MEFFWELNSRAARNSFQRGNQTSILGLDLTGNQHPHACW